MISTYHDYFYEGLVKKEDSVSEDTKLGDTSVICQKQRFEQTQISQ